MTDFFQSRELFAPLLLMSREGERIGFSREDVAVIRWLADYVKCDHETGYHITKGYELADRIERLIR